MLTPPAFQGTFQLRVKAYNNWQSAQTALAKKRENEVKLQTAGKPEKLAQAKVDIEEVSFSNAYVYGCAVTKMYYVRTSCSGKRRSRKGRRILTVVQRSSREK